MFDTPVILFCFNRPTTVQTVFAQIARLKPKKLYLVADGPRKNHPDDIMLCAQVQNIILAIDWECQISTLFFEDNQGCRKAFLQGLNWIFTQENHAIILEDDCVPDLTFFTFCQELLDLYEDQPQIMSIAGFRYLPDNINSAKSYCFSKYTQSWGWATWKRAWSLMDAELTTWDDLQQASWLDTYLLNQDYSTYWRHIFNKMKNGMDTWDYAWIYSCWKNSGLTIHPNVNLISPIGFGLNATHNRDEAHPAAFRKTIPMAFPLRHPGEIILQNHFEEWVEEHYFSGMNKRRIHLGFSRILTKRRQMTKRD